MYFILDDNNNVIETYFEQYTNWWKQPTNIMRKVVNQTAWYGARKEIDNIWYNKVFISTVFLGTSISLNPSDKRVFETCIFLADLNYISEQFELGKTFLEENYTTYEEAKKGHLELFKKWREIL